MARATSKPRLTLNALLRRIQVLERRVAELKAEIDAAKPMLIGVCR